jgi:conjugation system TraG family ATPase
MERNLKEIFPIYFVEKDCIVSKQGDITIGFEAKLPEIFTLSNEEYEAFHQTLIKAIRILPRNSLFHKQDWFVQANYKADFKKNGVSFLSTSSERFFNERPFLKHTCYIFVTRKPVNRKVVTSLYSSLLKKTIVPEETIKPGLLQDFLESVGQFERILSDSGFVQLKRLKDDDLAGTEKSSGIIERYCNLSSPREPLILRDINFKNGIQIGDLTCQLYSLSDVQDLPSLCGSRINYDKYSTDKTKFSIGFASPLGQLLFCNHIYNQFIVVDDVQKTLQKLESKRLRLQSLSTYSRENAIARDATNNFLNEAIASQRMPVKAHFNIFAWSDDAAEIKDLKNKVSSAMAQMDAVAKQEVTGAPQLWWAGIPGNGADLPANECFDTFAEQACCFLNLETNYRNSKSSFGLRLNDRITGIPVHVDIDDEPLSQSVITNLNKVVIGSSGSGKSVFMCHLQRSYYEQGAHIVIVDVGHSYSGLCRLLNGYYFTYDEKNPIRFNPFFIGEGDVLDTEKKESIKALLLSLWKKDNENFTRAEYVALSNAIQLYYKHLDRNKNIFPCFNSFYEFLQTQYVEVLKADNVKEIHFDVTNFLYVLRPYYKGGEYDYLLNATENLDILQQRFIVFELDNIKDHQILFPAVTLIIMELFVSKMRKLKGIRKVITIEEAWKAIAKAGMAEFMKYLYKTVRKFFGIAITVTQEIDDIISSPVVKEAIINNADCKILLDMRKFQNKFDQIQALLGLSDKGKTLLLSVNIANDRSRKYREVYIDLAGQLMKVYAYEPSSEEYYAYTTQEKEKTKVLEHASRFGGNMEKGIASFISDLKQ